MRDPDRIIRIIQLLEKGWKKNPDLRLGQIFENLKRYSGKKDLFYLEDEETERLIMDYFDLEESGVPCCPHCSVPMDLKRDDSLNGVSIDCCPICGRKWGE